VLPRSSGDALSNAGRALANKHGSGCPECGSAIYMRVDENGSDTSRECAECGAHYKARLSTHQRALLIEEEAACE
jgi:Zn ribbon nucleic-acid-binding protein